MLRSECHTAGHHSAADGINCRRQKQAFNKTSRSRHRKCCLVIRTSPRVIKQKYSTRLVSRFTSRTEGQSQPLFAMGSTSGVVWNVAIYWGNMLLQVEKMMYMYIHCLYFAWLEWGTFTERKLRIKLRLLDRQRVNAHSLNCTADTSNKRKNSKTLHPPEKSLDLLTRGNQVRIQFYTKLEIPLKLLNRLNNISRKQLGIAHCKHLMCLFLRARIRVQGQDSKIQSTYCSRYRFDSNTLKRYMPATEALY